MDESSLESLLFFEPYHFLSLDPVHPVLFRCVLYAKCCLDVFKRYWKLTYLDCTIHSSDGTDADVREALMDFDVPSSDFTKILHPQETSL